MDANPAQAEAAVEPISVSIDVVRQQFGESALRLVLALTMVEDLQRSNAQMMGVISALQSRVSQLEMELTSVREK